MRQLWWHHHQTFGQDSSRRHYTTGWDVLIHRHLHWYVYLVECPFKHFDMNMSSCFKSPTPSLCSFVPLRPPAAAAAGWAPTGAGGPSKWAPWWRWSGRGSAARSLTSATRSSPQESGWESSSTRPKARTTAPCRASATSPARRIVGYLWDNHR